MSLPLAANSFWELLAIVFIVAVPTVPVTYLLWTTIVSGRDARSREVTSGTSSATPFALLSIVGTVVLVVAALTMLVVIVLRAGAT
jgi:hypothetical protein